MSQMYDKIVEILVRRFGVEPEEIQPDVTFEELEMDSLFLVELILTLQSELGLKIRDDLASPRDSIGKVADLLDAQIARSA